MRQPVPERILEIIEEINEKGCANLTRLTVLKKWFEKPHRLSAFGLWLARRAAGHRGKAKEQWKLLLREAKALLGSSAPRGSLFQKIDTTAGKAMYRKACAAQQDYVATEWGKVRHIHCWPLLLVEKGLAVHLGMANQPSDGYQLAADWARENDPSQPEALTGPSAGRLLELVRFMFLVEALEEE